MKIVAAAIVGLLAVPAQGGQAAGAQKKAAISRKNTPADKPQVKYRWDLQKSGVADDLVAVCFVNPQTGYAVGKEGAIIKTTDGGNTWNRLMERRERTEFHRVLFSSATDGWVLSDALLHTSDGGESWQPAVPLPGPPGFGGGSLLGSALLQLHVHNMGVGVFRSDDGGRSWKTLGEPPRNDYTTVSFADDQHGWVSGDYGRLASTADGGATWTEVEAPLKGNFDKMQFVSPQTGWIMPRGGHQGGLLATTDGGKTWTTQYAGVATSRPIIDFQFLSAQTGFLVAEPNNDAAVLVTANGGKSWKTIGGVEKYSRAMSFPAADEGWVVGPKGYIIHYHKVMAE